MQICYTLNVAFERCYLSVIIYNVLSEFNIFLLFIIVGQM